MKETSKKEPIIYKTLMRVASFIVVLTLVGSVATGKIVFRDDFEDGNATDGVPVAWSPSSSFPGSYEVIDGDYVLTRPMGNEEMYSGVNQYILADTSIRAQARLIGSGGLWLALFARVNVGDAFYGALLYNNGKLQIWRYGRGSSDSWVLASADVGIDPRAQDVLLRFDVVGNELSAWAWREGDPTPAEPQATAVHSEAATGGLAVGADLGWRLSNNDAIFRYVEVYEAVPLSPDFNGDGAVNIKDLLRVVGSWEQDDPVADIAPPPFGDGAVNALDLELLMSYWEQAFDDPTLVAHWALDEAAGGVALDSAGGNDGYVFGGPVWEPDGGQVGGAVNLDGIDDYIVAGSALNPADGPFSVFVWVNGGAPGQAVISQFNGDNWLRADPTSGCLATELCASGRGGVPLQSTVNITDGSWHRVGFSWDGVHRVIYVDDIPVAEDTQTGLEGSVGGLKIGGGIDLAAGTFWSGLIDDVRIYNRAVSP